MIDQTDPTPPPRHMTMFVEWLDEDAAHVALVNRYHLTKNPLGPFIEAGNQLEISSGGVTIITPIAKNECLALAVAFLNAYSSPSWPEGE